MNLDVGIYVVLIIGSIVIDVHFIGISSLLFFKHHAARLISEKVLATVQANSIQSDCFGSERLTSITKRFEEYDSIIAVTNQDFQIGRRLLSYHYRIALGDIVHVTFQNGRETKYELVVHAATAKGKCVIRITLNAWRKTRDQKIHKFVDILRERTKGDKQAQHA